MPGARCLLTIDRELQRNSLVHGVGAEKRPRCAVMDVQNGDVLRSSPSTPGYDPNLFNVGINATQWRVLLTDDHQPLIDKSLARPLPAGLDVQARPSHFRNSRTRRHHTGFRRQLLGAGARQLRVHWPEEAAGTATSDLHRGIAQSFATSTSIMWARRLGIRRHRKRVRTSSDWGTLTNIEIQASAPGDALIIRDGGLERRRTLWRSPGLKADVLNLPGQLSAKR